jgi:outer membrane protein assembly factor BamC
MKPINKPSLALLALATITVSGCESLPFVDKTPDYKSAGRARPLEVPPDLTSISSNDTYSVPGSSTTYSSYSQGQNESPLEQEKILPNADNVSLERAGAQRWLVVQAPPEKIWPVIREFWGELGFAVRVENPETGVMETEWLNPQNLTKDEKGGYLDKFQSWLDSLNTIQNRQKFRTRLDRGTTEGTTEIYMSHRSVSDAPPDDGKIKVRTRLGEIDNGYAPKNIRTQEETARADAEDIDAELLRRLMVRLGVEEKKSHSIVAANNAEVRAKITQDQDGTVNLSLVDEFDRAWRRVGLALDRVGFVVEDKNRSQGLYYVRYTDLDTAAPPEQKKGLLDKLKFWGDDEKEAAKNSAPEKAPAKEETAPSKKEDTGLVDKLKFWKAPEKAEKVDPSNQYLIKVESSDNGSTVKIVNKDGSQSRSATATRITKLLFDQLK